MKTTRIQAMQRGLLSMADVARKVNLAPSQIFRYAESGLFSFPRHRIAKRSFYTVPEANEVINQINKYRKSDFALFENE